MTDHPKLLAILDARMIAEAARDLLRIGLSAYAEPAREILVRLRADLDGFEHDEMLENYIELAIGAIDNRQYRSAFYHVRKIARDLGYMEDWFFPTRRQIT